MRQIIVLGGNSPKNAKWAAELASHLSQYGEARFQKYEHWSHPDTEIDFETELLQLKNSLQDTTDTYIIVAKSAGALLALQGIAAGDLSP